MFPALLVRPGCAPMRRAVLVTWLESSSASTNGFAARFVLEQSERRGRERFPVTCGTSTEKRFSKGDW